MKKIIVVVLSAVFAVMAIEPVHSATVPTIAIIDTAVDSSKYTNVVYEVCFTQESTCPNKTNSQEGKGSASVTNWMLGFGTASTIDHGNQVVQAATSVNQNLKVVFIRIADERLTSSHLYGESRQRAMNWVLANYSKFGISAVSISQSLGLQTPSSCLMYEGYSAMRSTTQSLFEKNVSVFAATGNNGDKTRVGFPACIDNVIAVGATRLSGTAWASYSNIGTGTNGTGINAVARGDASVYMYGKPGLNTATGTSIATPIAAAFTATNIGDRTLTQFMSTLPNKIGYPQFGN